MNSLRKVQILCGLLSLLTSVITGCSAIKNSQYLDYLSSQSESAECVTDYTYTTSTAINGTAKFYKRGINLSMQASDLKGFTLGDPLATPLPIRYAEVAVYNSQNKIIQCGSTDSLGNLKALDGVSDLSIPTIAGDYSVRVLARTHVTLAYPSKPDFEMFVSVKEDIYTNRVYSISKSGYSNGVDGITNLNILGYARQTDSIGIEGGAFNILNSLQTAYLYVQSNTGTVDTTCLSEKLNVFWKAGFNPRQYVDPTKNPSYLPNGSFYIKENKSLYITGGRLGNISIDTTNHFDDFVIIHEFGHFVESQCGQLTSPGGNHSLIVRIDPRLAWSEGWANYFAGQVMYNDSVHGSALNTELPTKLSNVSLPTAWTYLFASKGFSDTYQNINNGSGFMFDMKKPGSSPDTWQYGDLIGYSFDRVDPSHYPGEGHFREGAVTRGLFKLSNNCGGSCIGTTPILFENIWTSMDKITGAGQSVYAFKDSHRVLEILKNTITVNNTAPANWTPYKNFNQLNTSEALHLFSDGIYTTGAGPTAINRWTPYGTFLLNRVAGACPNGLNYIEPRSDDALLTGTNSDQRYSNQFFTLDLASLAGVTQINVTFTKQYGPGTNTEFDLLLYGEDYFHTLDYSCSSIDENGNCQTSWLPSRSTAADVLRSDRRGGLIATKTIRTLNLLNSSQKYLLNVRAYTAGKSFSSLTDYSFSITDQDGLSLCP